MIQITTKDKLNKNKPITDSKAVAFFKDVIRPVLGVIVSFRVSYKVVIEHPCRLLPNKPVIYAVNHFCFADTPIMGRIIPQRSYILSGKQRLGFSDWLYFVLNGVIFVDRKDKGDLAASKLAISAYLNKGRSIVMFPEGTWNLTENQLMLPMKWGIIDIAKKNRAQIIPTTLEYDREKKRCFVRFGAPLVFSPEDSKADAIVALRDTLATMRWELWKCNGTFKRANLDIATEQMKLFYSVEEYPPIDWEYERSCIYQPYPSPKDVYAHLDQLIPCRENAFLFRNPPF